jgi:hypothetical protein
MTYYVGLYGYNWFLSKYIVEVGLLTYSHKFLGGSNILPHVFRWEYVSNLLYILFFFYDLLPKCNPTKYIRH